eukprot:SM000208S06327  [mRNA]  locus=s208:215485:218288:+ [translate_table: standard]
MCCCLCCATPAAQAAGCGPGRATGAAAVAVAGARGRRPRRGRGWEQRPLATRLPAGIRSLSASAQACKLAPPGYAGLPGDAVRCRASQAPVAAACHQLAACSRRQVLSQAQADSARLQSGLSTLKQHQGFATSCCSPPVGVSSDHPVLDLRMLLIATSHPLAARQKRWWRPMPALPDRNTCQASTASRGSPGTHGPDATPRVRSPPGQDQLPWLASSCWASLVSTLQGANAYLPQAVLGSTILALAHPPAFTWFTTTSVNDALTELSPEKPHSSLAFSCQLHASPMSSSVERCVNVLLLVRNGSRYYAPALGMLMFAVGINLSVHDFELVLHRPAAIALGYFGQFVVKPVLGVLASSTLIPLLHLPEAIGSGLVLTACVSGAQLSNYATFLVERSMAPLSIVMTALSTLSAVLVTPALTLALLGKRLPVDFKGMMLNILQIVLVPITAGLLLNRYGGKVASAVKPFLPVVSVVTTALCVGSPLATNITSLRSATGLLLVVPVVAFHTAAFVAGYWMAVASFRKNTEQVALARTISLETAWTGMQSSLLALALANRFFSDPLVSLCPAISTVLMSLMGFALVLLWSKPKSMDGDVRA